ncbi:hypothetical protein Acr_02g0008200 [Actinidia rufa]|uniref:Uncharacterized protein n=1 Tax=Actinidia rufa TaxID=165716 RepID=A0A7J0E859_9ERIC|nr:hypothetical protein Acr_02g0008200 [Actinidia rufa]
MLLRASIRPCILGRSGSLISMMLTTDLSHKMVSKLEQIIVDIGIHLSEQSALFYAPERWDFQALSGVHG